MNFKIIMMALTFICGASAPVFAQEGEPEASAPVSVPQDRIVARVNSDIVTSGDIWQRYYTVQRSAGLPDNTDIRADVFPQILNGLIDESLQLQEATRLGIDINDEIMEAALLDMAKNNDVASVQEFEAMMQKQGVSIKNVERQVKPQIAWGGVVQRVLRPDISVPDEEIAQLRDTLNETKGVTEYQIAEIVLDASDEVKRKNALDLAKNLSKEMARGAPFRQVAAKFSQSPSKQQGGLLGWVTKTELPNSLHETLEKLPKGRLSPPVIADNKVFLILKLNERIGQGAPDDEVIQDRLLNRKLEKAAIAYLQDLRDQALIVFP